ncbi:hypothetical protein L3Q82_003627 [Scomber scombrus]|uniref:Tc1-like transposase DDE domain-containing protein n=1 Tax=Scomber scombrus TaxID=13677 RepID=A0AAV1QL64_SCOSC
MMETSRRALCISHCCHQMRLWWWWCYSEGRPNFIFMDDNAPAHRGRIIRERLLETGVPQMEWPALFSRPQLSRRVKARNSVPQNLNDPSRRVGCHASADNKSTCGQHETSLSSCN